MLGERARRVRWWVRALMGEDAYDKYVLHHESCETDAAHPLMTEREFWRDQTDRQDKNPQGRCC
ncbi:YbdD/YjiX family protein [Cryobacterium sp. PH31-O1]|uniref:YbdD/YjiX family protein n=1 Tax=Cryobacterium sp. PH31-O1 TaxID=3046306 RepID=UPI0024BB871C|nr:YbdD/YjiX family protein [Cryobacterium sp. PH31-O1]MDJ0339852.1 YbdD/YjiX family protein [Cryobacterium sp. PH31-O1]